ncbi:MAG: hypothetical protein K6F33_06910 [Bacteroidales bacterium]|nr:hypothetical protein [Bacteroidales bacterium]
MKRVMIYVKIASAALLLVMMQACNGNISESLSFTRSNLETRIATTTELLLQNMSDTYDKVQELSFETEYDGVVAGILASNVENYEPSPLISDSLRLRMQLIHLYKQAVHEYALLVDDGFKGKMGLFGNCCKSIHEMYKLIDDSVAEDFGRRVLPIVRASRYDKNDASLQLVNSLATVWSQDVQVLSNKLSNSFEDYQVALSSIPEDAFDEEKLAKHVSAPYNGKHNLAEIYKIELIKERRNMLHALVQQEINVTSALQYLQHALTEFVKKSGDNDVVVNYLNRIEILLEPGNNVETDGK